MILSCQNICKDFSEKKVLEHISFHIEDYEKAAIVGINGAGKTTFIKLLCRLYDPTEGEILLNGIDIRKYNYHEYMQLFSVVFQDFRLLSFELGQNVAGSINVNLDKADQCLRDAGFGIRLDELPQGLSTAIYKDFDEKGVTISGGEAQKIALARALYKDAPFIILDEPTYRFAGNFLPKSRKNCRLSSLHPKKKEQIKRRDFCTLPAPILEV